MRSTCFDLEGFHMTTGQTPEASTTTQSSDGVLVTTHSMTDAQSPTGTLVANFSVSSNGDLTMRSLATFIPKGSTEPGVCLAVGKWLMARAISQFWLKAVQTLSKSPEIKKGMAEC